ncbi:toxin YhaV [Marinospirillum celere]|uniref:Toxin YhaV n=1 Tax=Marinospirillum celere TaxID=1122252 RepID=A0A1I1I0Z2_9GAMM|nr:type II toxin-antitoxin system YhaV family toxin [Marinospirillum celere]SFC29977.1 toxin YhaV [Marinospirillum celere]
MSQPLKINGWTIYAHPLFLEQVERLKNQVKRLKDKDPEGYRKKSASKRLAAIIKLALHDIPQDPAGAQYRQGHTLGAGHTHWHRAKFFQQYRLFFRYDLESKILIYAWVNDDKTKRAFESKQDAYTVFYKMLKNGNPPNSWAQLKAEAASESENAKTVLAGKSQ